MVRIHEVSTPQTPAFPLIIDRQVIETLAEPGITFHEVRGTMALEGGTVRFDTSTGIAGGTITADARRAETGNDKRDKTMHADVLESEHYPTLAFRLPPGAGRTSRSGIA